MSSLPLYLSLVINYRGVCALHALPTIVKITACASSNSGTDVAAVSSYQLDSSLADLLMDFCYAITIHRLLKNSEYRHVEDNCGQEEMLERV
jgi:hypothetical protein